MRHRRSPKNAIVIAPIIIEPTRHATHGPCPHCGGLQQTIWGWVHLGEGTRAAYYVRWTAGHPEHGMVWMVSVGRWDAHGIENERRSVGLKCRMVAGRPQFMIVDAATTPWGVQKRAMFGALLTRAAASGSDTAKEVFAYVDQILIKDPRVERFVRSGEGMPASESST